MSREQELLWKSDAGESFFEERPITAETVRNRTDFLEEALSKTSQIATAIEFGAGNGLGLKALRSLYPKASLAAIELNAAVAKALPKDIEVWIGSALDYESTVKYDLVLTTGFLMCISPEDLEKAYTRLYNACSRYLLLAEYHLSQRAQMPWRHVELVGNGYSQRATMHLTFADHAGAMLEAYQDLHLKDYGFAYHLGRYAQPDFTWFLIERY